MRRSWTEEEKTKIKELYLEGNTLSHIGEVMGASRSSIASILRNSGVYRNGHEWTKQDIVLLKKFYDKGSSIEDLQKRFNRTERSINHAIMKYGLLREKTRNYGNLF